jgi:S-adenosylmethionine/arginine decarboxylase-like enzyme
MVQRTKSPKRRSRAHDKHAFEQLGRRMFFRGIALHGDLHELEWRKLLIMAAHAMDMSPVASAASWQYPLGGAGGNGWTIVQPITESFLALDTWPDHGGAYLFIASCKPFKPDCLRAVLKHFGLKQGQAIGAPDTLELA